MTPTLHPTEAGLLRAICEDPADDCPRLVLADWLEQHGAPERAEFIRVQCAIAKWPCECDSEERVYHEECQCNELYALRRREQELLSPGNAQQWLAGFPLLLPEKGSVGWRRGFVAEVSCTSEVWCGAKCPCGDARLSATAEVLGGGCSDCRGTGRLGAHGPALVRAAPLERVTLTDVDARLVDSTRPNETSRWLVGSHGQDMPFRCPIFDTSSREVILATVFRSALAWARRQAGLPAPS